MANTQIILAAPFMDFIHVLTVHILTEGNMNLAYFQFREDR